MPSVNFFPEAPGELIAGRLKRLSEGVGNVVYASENWVIKRQRSPSEIIALILVWKFFRKCAWILPRSVEDRLLRRPSRIIRFLRVLLQPVVSLIPRGAWMLTHSGDVWRLYRKRSRRGDRLAIRHLTGTELIPERIEFPPTRIAVGGWPGWLTVTEAVERVDTTLDKHLARLARAGDSRAIEECLNRLLALRQDGWKRGLFSVDAHLKNFGVLLRENRIVLLDSGGLTQDWSEIEASLRHQESLAEPHAELGLKAALAPFPEVAARFNAKWKAAVNPEAVRAIWRAAETAQAAPAQPAAARAASA